MRRSILSCLLACASLPAFAQSHATLAPPPSGADEGWTARAELGLAMASGNTDTQSFVGKMEFAFSDPRHKLGFGASGHYATDGVVGALMRRQLPGSAAGRSGRRGPRKKEKSCVER